MQNAGTSNRCPGWDLCFSAPKDLSVLFSQADQEKRRVIERIQTQAVEETLRFTEQRMAFSRVGKAAEGCDLVRAGMAFAVFAHHQNRENEPQLHHHCLAMNIGTDADGKTRSISSRPIFQNKMLLGAYYRAWLSSLIVSELKLETERRGNFFSIAGIPQEVREAHSTRAKQIQERMKEQGVVGGKMAAIAALDTRREKEEMPSWEERFADWRALNESMGFTEEYIARLPKARTREPAKLLKKAIGDALGTILRGSNHFTESQLLLHTLWALPAYGIPPQGVDEAIADFLRSSSSIVPLRAVDHQMRFTTKRVLECENRLFEALDFLKQTARVARE